MKALNNRYIKRQNISVIFRNKTSFIDSLKEDGNTNKHYINESKSEYSNLV
jgi:hypothetical protein